MPSNKELIATATQLGEELAEKLGSPVNIETDGKTNEQLVALVSDLRAKVADAGNPTEADAAEAAAKAEAEDKATAEEAAKKAARKKGDKAATKKPPFYVAPGKALTSKKGILSGDHADEVKAEYLAGGQKALDGFVESGHVLKG